MNFSGSTANRSWTPVPTSPLPSYTLTANLMRARSTSVTSTLQNTSEPIGDAETWAMSTRVPTDVLPSRASERHLTAVRSTIRTMQGVARTGRVPLPHDSAVSSAVTVMLVSAYIPGSIMVPASGVRLISVAAGGAPFLR